MGQKRLIAVAKMTSPYFERENKGFGKYGVRIAWEATIEPPVTKLELSGGPLLSKFRVFSPTGAHGTNFPLDDQVARRLETVVANRLVRQEHRSETAVQTEEHLEPSYKALIEAINESEKAVSTQRFAATARVP